MNSNEKIFVNHFWCSTAEDVYEQGEVGPECISWTANDLQFDKSVGYDTINDALAAVMKANSFTFDKTGWENGIEYSDDYSRFDTSLLVTNDNSEALDYDIERWKRKELKLYSCHVTVILEVRSVARPLTENEIKEWKANCKAN